MDLLHQFTDEHLATVMPTAGGDVTAGDWFAFLAGKGHATEHMSSVEEGLREARVDGVLSSPVGTVVTRSPEGR